MKRRYFLKSAGATLALGGLGLHATLASAAGFQWSRAGAAALIGQSFWLNHPERGALALTLTAVQAPAQQPDPRLEQFSLRFRAPGAVAIADASYDMDHPAIGRFSLHLAPAGQDAEGAAYRADFTLLT